MKYFLNPFVQFITALSVIALLQIIKQPTPIWQYSIGLLLALLLLNRVGGFIGLFDGETIFIISDKPIFDLKNFSLSEGKVIAKNIEVIDQLLITKNLQML